MLMKYIYKDGPYPSALFARLENVTLVTASFYTWKGGTDPQKTQEGLLRSLLYDIIEEIPALQQFYAKKRRRGGKEGNTVTDSTVHGLCRSYGVCTCYARVSYDPLQMGSAR